MKKKVRLLVLSEKNSAMSFLATRAAEMMGADLEVEEMLDRNYGSFPLIFNKWQEKPTTWDGMLLGYPHTVQGAIFSHSKTLHAEVVSEGCNALYRIPNQELQVLGDDTRARAIQHTLSLKDLQVSASSAALVIGEGCPALAAAWACRESGFVRIEILNPGGKGCKEFRGVKEEDVRGPFSLIVNAVRPGGTGGGGIYTKVPIDLEFLTQDVTVLDVIYNPLDTPLLQAAAARGCTVIDGTTPVALRVLYAMEHILGGAPGAQAFLSEVLPTLQKKHRVAAATV